MYQMYITKENIQDAAYKCLAAYYDERYSADIPAEYMRGLAIWIKDEYKQESILLETYKYGRNQKPIIPSDE